MQWQQIIDNDELQIWPTEKAGAHQVLVPKRDR